jgi:DNA-binding response OmpR family regulator
VKKILIVDDEQSIVESIKYNIEKEGFDAVTASDGEEALQVFSQETPDLIILDLMLPKLSGEEVCKYIRKESQVPIIMLTAKGHEVDRVVGLEIGADDYVIKPFSMRELVARVKAVLRRITATANTTRDKETDHITLGPFDLDVKRHEIRKSGKVLDLTLKEFKTLELLMRNAGRVLTRDIILNRVWGEDYFGDTKTVDVHVRRLRKKIEKNPSNPEFIGTVRGVGYRFEVEK